MQCLSILQQYQEQLKVIFLQAIICIDLFFSHKYYKLFIAFLPLLDGADYTGVSQSVTFQPGEVEKFISVKIVDDDMPEGVETFSVTLTTDDTNVNIPIKTSSAEVTIVDHDRKWVFWYIVQSISLILLVYSYSEAWIYFGYYITFLCKHNYRYVFH